jgi:hypothetical protein
MMSRNGTKTPSRRCLKQSGSGSALQPVCRNGASRPFIESAEGINTSRRAEEHFTQVAVLARKICPCGDILCGLVIINSPLFFCPLNLQLVIVASVALCDNASANKGWSRSHNKERGESRPCQCDPDLSSHIVRDAERYASVVAGQAYPFNNSNSTDRIPPSSACGLSGFLPIER